MHTARPPQDGGLAGESLGCCVTSQRRPVRTSVGSAPVSPGHSEPGSGPWGPVDAHQPCTCAHPGLDGAAWAPILCACTASLGEASWAQASGSRTRQLRPCPFPRAGPHASRGESGPTCLRATQEDRGTARDPPLLVAPTLSPTRPPAYRAFFWGPRLLTLPPHLGLPSHCPRSPAPHQ